MEFRVTLNANSILQTVSIASGVGLGEPMEILGKIIKKYSGDDVWAKTKLEVRNKIRDSLVDAGSISVDYKVVDAEGVRTCITYVDNSQTCENTEDDNPIATMNVVGKLSVDDAFALVADKVVPQNDWVVCTAETYFKVLGVDATVGITTDDTLISASPLCP